MYIHYTDTEWSQYTPKGSSKLEEALISADPSQPAVTQDCVFPTL